MILRGLLLYLGGLPRVGDELVHGALERHLLGGGSDRAIRQPDRLWGLSCLIDHERSALHLGEAIGRRGGAHEGPLHAKAGEENGASDFECLVEEASHGGRSVLGLLGSVAAPARGLFTELVGRSSQFLDGGSLQTDPGA